MLSFTNLIDYLPFDSGYVIQEITPPVTFYGKTLSKLEIRNKFNLTIIAIRSTKTEKMSINPRSNYIIKETDILYVFGLETDIEKFDKNIS